MEREGKENVAWRRCAKSRIVGERDIKIRVDAKSETHLVNCKVASLRLRSLIEDEDSFLVPFFASAPTPAVTIIIHLISVDLHYI